VHAATWRCEIAGDYELQISLGSEPLPGSLTLTLTLTLTLALTLKP
jgi:hypothetical protein